MNSIFISTGTNLGNKIQNLEKAKLILAESLELLDESQIYESSAVDFLDQPDFYNQVLEFKIPDEISKESLMINILEMEKKLGRNRTIPKGPRIIDIDILFWGHETYHSETLMIPHPRLFERSFIVLPLSELSGFKLLSEKFHFNFNFQNSAKPLS